MSGFNFISQALEECAAHFNKDEVTVCVYIGKDTEIYTRFLWFIRLKHSFINESKKELIHSLEFFCRENGFKYKLEKKLISERKSGVVLEKEVDISFEYKIRNPKLFIERMCFLEMSTSKNLHIDTDRAVVISGYADTVFRKCCDEFNCCISAGADVYHTYIQISSDGLTGNYYSGKKAYHINFSGFEKEELRNVAVRKGLFVAVVRHLKKLAYNNSRIKSIFWIPYAAPDKAENEEFYKIVFELNR